MIHIESNFKDIFNEIDRVTSRMPTLEMKESLDAILSVGFNLTQGAVHIQTGSLKSSGKKSSRSIKTRKRWEGEIEYGGPSSSVNNPVDYAIYEKERDGSHDFFAPLYLLHPYYVAAIQKELGDG